MTPAKAPDELHALEALNLAGIGACIFRADGALVRASDRARDLLGMYPSDAPYIVERIIQTVPALSELLSKAASGLDVHPIVTELPAGCVGARWLRAAAQRRSSQTFGETVVWLLLEDETALHEMRPALDESNVLLRHVVSCLHDTLVAVLDSDLRYVFAAAPPELEKRFGVLARDLVGEDWSSRLPARGLRRYRRQLEKVLETGAPAEAQYLLAIPKGYYWLNVALAPLRDAAGRVHHVICLAKDITPSKSLERSHMESEKRYRRITEALTDYIYTVQITDGVPGKTTHSAACEAVTGYTQREFEEDGYLWIRMVPAEDHAIVQAQVDAILAGRDVGPVEHRIIRKDGHERWVRNTPSPQYNQAGKLISYDGLLSDITERKRAEIALAEKNRLLNTLLQHLPDAVLVTSTSGEIQMANQAFARLVGVESLWAATGQPIESVLLPEAAAVARADREEITRTGQPIINRPETVTSPEGRERYLLTTKAPLRNTWGEITSIIRVSRDITERKREEEARLEMIERMQQTQKLESLGVMAGGVAHDFNNILMAMLGNIELAASQVPEGSEPARELAEATKAGNRAAELCRQMLAYSGRGQLVVEPVDLPGMIRDMSRLIEVSVSDKVRIEYAFDETLPSVEADVTQLRQVLVNLLTNASEAMGDGTGRIRVACKDCRLEEGVLPHDTMEARHPAGRYVCLSVEDDGRGMSEETRRRAFEPFYTTKFTGRGLGLAAVLGIVRGHGGFIEVESTPGHGTKVRIYFPACALGPASERTPGKDAGGQADRAAATVLVVDDDPSVRNLASVMLKRAGYQVDTAMSGVEALERFRQAPDAYDCAMLDVRMPGLDGPETMAAMRELRPKLPVLLSSGFSERDLDSAIKLRQPMGYIQKPYRFQDLLAALQGVLQEAAAGPPSA